MRGATSALFALGQVLAYSGRYAEARPQLGRLRSEFPESPYVREADKLEATFPPSAPEAPAPAAKPSPPAQPQV